MNTDKLLRKLEPLLPEKVRGWRRALDLVDADLRSLLEKEIFSTAHNLLGDFRKKLLLSLPPKERIKGAIHLGTILYEEEKWPAGLQLGELLQNMAIFGRSGAGKTNVTFHLLKQLAKKNIPFLFFDWKRTARHLLPALGQGTQIFTPGRSLAPFPFNPFIPPPGLEARVYVNHVVDVLGDAYTLGDAARSILQKALRKCHEEGNLAPTTEEIARKIDALPNQERVRGWKATAARALDSVAAIDLADNTTQATMVKALIKQNTIIELEALAPSNRKFLLPLLCQWIYYLKMSSSKREQLSLVIIIEEAHHLLYKREASRETLMEQLLRQCREIGIGIVVVDQHPHLISSAALGNTYTSICLNLKDPRDSNKAAALSLMEDDKMHFSLLPVGQGVVKLQDRWRHPFLVKFPLVNVQKGAVTDEVLEELSRGKTTLSELRAREQNENADVEDFRLSDDVLSRAGIALLNDVLQHEKDGVQARYERLGLSADNGNKVKRELIAKNFLEEERVNTGRTRRVLLRLSTRAREQLGVQAVGTTPESLAHSYWKRWWAEKLEREGYRVWVEAPRNKGRVDVLGTRAGESVAIEVETGKSDVIENVRQDLLSGFQRIIVVATDKAAYKKVEEQLARAGLLMDRVRVVLRDAVDKVC